MIASIPKKQRMRFYRDGSVKMVKRIKPFAVNPRGILTHRAKCVDVFYRDGKPHHKHVDYWCGNGTCFDLDDTATVLVDKPPKDRLLCHFCEMKATAARQPKSYRLAKRHVHVGVLRAIQLCCTGVLR